MSALRPYLFISALLAVVFRAGLWVSPTARPPGTSQPHPGSSDEVYCRKCGTITGVRSDGKCAAGHKVVATSPGNTPQRGG